MPINRPTSVDLIEAVREFLENNVMTSEDKRTAFHARVAVNVLSIVQRELESGSELDDEERNRLCDLLDQNGDLGMLNQELCRQIRDEKIALDDESLKKHLYQTVIGKLSIDNPKYSAYKKLIDH